MPVYSIQATTHPQSLVTWNIAHGYNTTVSLSGGVTLAVQYQRFGYADMICRLYFPGDTTESLPSVTVNEIVYHYDGSSYVYDHVNTNSRSGAYNSTYNVTAYLLSGNESMITGSYDQTTNYTDATLFSSSASLDDMARIAREYFDNYEPTGQGTVTLSIKKPGQILNFTSRLAGKTISKYISGNAVVDMNNVVYLEVFKNGTFYNIISEFDIADYKEYVAAGAGAWTPSALAQWFRTKYGLVFRQPNGAVFQVQNSHIVKEYTGYAEVSCLYLIPINRTQGEYTKLRVNAALLAKESSIDPVIRSRVCWVSSDGTTLELPSTGYHSAHNYNPQVNVYEEYGDEISDIDYIDYITVEGITASVSYKSIKLIKDSINVTESPRNVIFENGKWGPGITTDFDFTCKEFSGSEQSIDINSYATHLYYSKYALWLHHTSQTIPYVIDGNYISHSPNSVHSSDSNTAKIYIPIKRAYGYTKCKVKMGQTSAGSGSMNFMSCTPGKINSNRQLSSIQYYEIANPSGINEYEIDISGSEYCDYIALGCNEGTCVWQSIVLE